MPKGYNADGTKKVRPANSGRKPKPSKQIAPQISLEAATILEAMKKQGISLNKFISEAILEKAANDATRKAAKSLASQPTPGQVDLVDMIQEINTEKTIKNVQQAGGLSGLVMHQSFAERLEEIKERIAQVEDQEKRDLDEWLDMPGVETWSRCQRLLKEYGKRKHKSALFIAISAQMPEPEFKRTWRCWIDVVEENGKSVGYNRNHASVQYVAEILNAPDWKKEKVSHDTTLFLLPINNPVKEKKPKVVKPRTPKPARANGSGFLIDAFALDSTDDLPEWAKPLAGYSSPETIDSLAQLDENRY